jgi:hypothetical protein
VDEHYILEQDHAKMPTATTATTTATIPTKTTAVGKGGGSTYHRILPEVPRILTRRAPIIPVKVAKERLLLHLRPITLTRTLAPILPAGIQPTAAGIKVLLTIEAMVQRLLSTLKMIRFTEALAAVLQLRLRTGKPANLEAVGIPIPVNMRGRFRL